MLVSITLDYMINTSQTVSWQVRLGKCAWKMCLWCKFKRKMYIKKFHFNTIDINTVSVSIVITGEVAESSGIRGRLWTVPMSRLSGESWTAVWSAKRQRIMCSWNMDRREWVHGLFAAGVINTTAQDDICRACHCENSKNHRSHHSEI